MDDQDGVDFNENREDRTKYATNYGENLADYTDMAMDINGYDDGMASSNNHVGNNSDYVNSNNQIYAELDKSKGDNKMEQISRDVALGFVSGMINVPDHRANIVIRDKIEDYPQDIREQLGDPVFVEGKGYVYILEDISVSDEGDPARLFPSVNNSKPAKTNSSTLDDYKNGTGRVQTYQTFDDDFEKEDALIRNYIIDIDEGIDKAPKYPSGFDTADCLANLCNDSFRNSNTSADTRGEVVGYPAPDTGLSFVPGGLHDREGSSDDRGGNNFLNNTAREAIKEAEKLHNQTKQKVKEVYEEVESW